MQSIYLGESNRGRLVYQMSAVSIAVGGLQLLAHGPLWMFWISTITLTVIGFIGIAYLLTSRSFLTPWGVFATSLSLSYGFGSLNTMISDYVKGPDFSVVTTASVDALSLAMGATLVLTSLLLLIGNLDNYKLIPSDGFSTSDQRDTLVVLLIVTVSAAIAVGTGMLGYQGDQSGGSDSKEVSPLASLVASSMTATLGSAVLAFAGRSRSRSANGVLLFCGLFLLAVQATQGRRVFLFAVMICAIAYFVSRGIRYMLTPKIIVILLAVSLTVFAVSRVFYAMRIATRSETEVKTMGELLHASWQILIYSELYNLDGDFSENNATRTFIVGYLGELIQASQDSGAWTGGQVLELDIAMAIPTVIWPDKWKFVEQGFSEEEVCHPVFGMPVWDAPNSALAAGFCDFRWFGMMGYPILVVAMMVLVNRLVWRSPILVRSLVSFVIIENLLQVENQVSAYFTSLRNIAMLGLLAWLLIWFRHRNDGNPSQLRMDN